MDTSEPTQKITKRDTFVAPDVRGLSVERVTGEEVTLLLPVTDVTGEGVTGVTLTGAGAVPSTGAGVSGEAMTGTGAVPLTGVEESGEAMTGAGEAMTGAGVVPSTGAGVSGDAMTGAGVVPSTGVEESGDTMTDGGVIGPGVSVTVTGAVDPGFIAIGAKVAGIVVTGPGV